MGWPEDDLERLGACPACGSHERLTLVEGLTDKVFRTAPGIWTMYRCAQCDGAYLDPRPTLATIGRAYQSYYTHGDARASVSPIRRKRLRTRLQNAYLNDRYGYKLPGAWPREAASLLLDARTKAKFDFLIRHLPAPGQVGARLLDVGCGDGAFLSVAADLGFAAVGLEPDPAAVKAARTHGRTVHEGVLDTAELERSSFDHLTLNHVLEHLHAPLEALRQAANLLKPGGRIWLSQPNLGALGRERFGGDWRGYEAPRHLTLFTAQGLIALLERAGFERAAVLAPDRTASFFFRQSQCLVEGLDPYAPNDPSLWPIIKKDAALADARAQSDPNIAETVTVVGFRRS